MATPSRVKRQTWLAWMLAPPLALLGIPLGAQGSLALFEWRFGPLGECGTPAVPFVLVGLIVGFFGGILTAVAVSGVATWLVTKCNGPSAAKAVTDEL